MRDGQTSVEIPADIDLELCRLLLGWDELERANGGRPVIDFNVSGVTSGSEFRDRKEVLDAILELKAALDPGSLVSARTVAHETYLRALMGQQFGFADYLAATQGVVPYRFPQDLMHQVRTEAERRLRQVEVDPEGPVDEQMAKLDPPLPQTAIEPTFHELLQEYRSSIEHALGTSLAFDLTIESVDVDEYWSYWVDGAADKFRLRLNRRRASFSWHECLQFTFHELLSHCGQMDAWRSLIAKGVLAKSLGVTTVHSPEQFMSEGIAQVMPVLLSSPASDNEMLLAQMTVRRFELLVINNVHCMINEGASIEQCHDYYERHSLRHRRRWFLDELSSRSLDPLYRSYQYVYATGAELSWDAVGVLEASDREELIRACFRSRTRRRICSCLCTRSKSIRWTTMGRELNGDAPRLFAYGTLQVPAVMQVLIGRVPRHSRAMLEGYACYELADRNFPGIIEWDSARVDGVLYRDLSDDELEAIDAFEDPAYACRTVSVAADDERVAALTYVVAPDQMQIVRRGHQWSLAHFMDEHAEQYVESCARFRESFGTSPRRAETE